MTGTSGHLCLTMESKSRPSMSGSRRSRIVRSGTLDSMASKASVPPTAVRVVPSSSSAIVRYRAAAGSSSTTRKDRLSIVKSQMVLAGELDGTQGSAALRSCDTESATVVFDEPARQEEPEYMALGFGGLARSQ